jgi:predicted O-methyltransferase YrrM
MKLSNIQNNILISSEVLMDEHKELSKRFVLQTHYELINLLVIFKYICPKKVLEFGFMNGGTLFHFLKNATPDCVFYTVDISFEKIAPNVKDELLNNSQINFLKMDSNKLEPKNIHDKFDFIFIDGGHDFETVKKDTENSLLFLSENGVIVWDDFNIDFDGVYKVINDLFLKGLNIYHIQDTSFAIFTKNDLSQIFELA